jgi:hypothetical protein
MAGGISPVLGMQENPHLMRVRRQIEEYKKGPPPGWVDAFAQWQQISAEVQQGNQAGAEAAGQTGIPYQAAAPPPPPPGPFDDQLPIDDEPQAAKIRHRAISRLIAGSQFKAWPEPWKALGMKEYMKAKNAAGVMTVPETQALQAQQAKDAAIAAEEARARISIKAGPEDGAAAIESTAAGARAAVAGQSPDVQSPAAQNGNGAAAQAGTHIHIHQDGGVTSHRVPDRESEPDPAGAPV